MLKYKVFILFLCLGFQILQASNTNFHNERDHMISKQKMIGVIGGVTELTH